MRAPYQILVFPYLRLPNNSLQYCIFQRRDSGVWQGIAGGGEDEETPPRAAQREAWEEAGISPDCHLLALRSRAQIPVAAIGGYLWGKSVPTVPEYAFGVELSSSAITLSAEHTAYAWLPLAAADERLEWESNSLALQELHQRLTT